MSVVRGARYAPLSSCVPRCVRNNAHSSLRALYIAARFPACFSFFLILSFALVSSRLVFTLVSSRRLVSSRLVSSPLCSRLVSPLCSRLRSSLLCTHHVQASHINWRRVCLDSSSTTRLPSSLLISSRCSVKIASAFTRYPGDAVSACSPLLDAEWACKTCSVAGGSTRLVTSVHLSDERASTALFQQSTGQGSSCCSKGDLRASSVEHR